MTNKKTLKRALLTSVMSLFLCFTMLLGTTYAWFTDSVSSANNTITTGNLDVALYYAKEYKGDATDWQPVTETTKLFNEDALYEPGFTEVVYFKVVNEGSLYLKYNMSLKIASETAGVNVAGQSFLLSDYLCANVLTPTQVANATNRDYIYETFGNETLAGFVYGKNYTAANAGWAKSRQLAPGASYLTGLTIFMPTTVGNEVNHNGTAPEITLGVTLLATQTTEETDSFNNKYDEFAGKTVVTPATAQAAIHAAQEGDVIYLQDGIYDVLVIENADGSPKKNLTVEHSQAGNGTSFSVAAINLNSSENITIRGIYFDVTKGVEVYKKDGTLTDYKAGIAGAKSGAATGAKNILIDSCTFDASRAVNNYVAIYFEEQGRPTSRATDITIINCSVECSIFNFVRANYLSEGKIVIRNNKVFEETYHSALNLTGNAADIVVRDNTFGTKMISYVMSNGWNPDKAMLGTSRQGTNHINIEVVGNTFIQELNAEGHVIDLKSSYKQDNTTLVFQNNTFIGMTEAEVPCIWH